MLIVGKIKLGIPLYNRISMNLFHISNECFNLHIHGKIVGSILRYKYRKDI